MVPYGSHKNNVPMSVVKFVKNQSRVEYLIKSGANAIYRPVEINVQILLSSEPSLPNRNQTKGAAQPSLSRWTSALPYHS